jgi:predicted RND superfamily exporter protein
MNFEFIRGMKEAYEQAGLYAFVGIVFLVVLAFRAVRPALLALIPLAVGSLWTLGLMGFFQVKFNVANLIVLPLIMAPAVEGGIMIIYRYREEARKVRRPSPLPQSTGRAVVFSSLSTIVGFGSLMISRHWGIFSVGLLLTVGVASVLLASVTVLPSLLTILSTIGRERADETDMDDEPSAAATPAPILASVSYSRHSAMDLPTPEKQGAAMPLELG